MGLGYLPALLSRDTAVKSRIPYRWTGVCLWLQRHLLGLDYRVSWQTDKPAGRAVFAVKHQSAWETIALWHILDRPVFVLKKELLDIPVFGWYLRHVDNIVIDRASGQKAVGQIITQAMHYLSQERVIVIFPEGTRTYPGATVRYKSGIGALYESLSPIVYPVAHNAGCFWPRNSYVRKSGTVQMEVLEPLPSGLNKKECIEMLHTRIEGATNRLLNDAKA